MAAPEFTVSALVFVLLICSVAGYPSGKVVMSCGGMIPQHGHRPQSEPVHQITVSQMKFKPGDQIQVTLSGPQFRGFLLEARDAEDLSGPPVGSFTLIDSEVSQLLTCEDVQGDDDAYLCIREDQTVYIRPSYLTGRSYPVMESTRVSVNLLGMHQVGPPSCSVAATDVASPAVSPAQAWAGQLHSSQSDLQEIFCA
ncbi:ferric-chelate reductase 1 [Cricetulus griseus]